MLLIDSNNLMNVIPLPASPASRQVPSVSLLQSMSLRLVQGSEGTWHSSESAVVHEMRDAARQHIAIMNEQKYATQEQVSALHEQRCEIDELISLEVQPSCNPARLTPIFVVSKALLTLSRELTLSRRGKDSREWTYAIGGPSTGTPLGLKVEVMLVQDWVPANLFNIVLPVPWEMT